jgi:hypothetical protein
MLPQMLFCPLAAIGITGLYTAWYRFRVARAALPDQAMRERVAYMLWITASRA